MSAPLEAAEVARACAVIAACASEVIASWAPDDSDDDPAVLTALCPRVTSWFEERSIPLGPSNERWSWLAREILRSGNDCARVRAATPELHSSEIGEVLRVTDAGVLAFVRRHASGPMVCAFNVTPEPRPLASYHLDRLGMQRPVNAIDGK